MKINCLINLLLGIICVFILNDQLIGQPQFLSTYYFKIPSVYSNIVPDTAGKLNFNGLYEKEYDPFIIFNHLNIEPSGTDFGIAFNFNNIDFRGKIYYGLLDKNKPQFEQVVYSKKNARISDGKAEINILELIGKNNIADLDSTEEATLSYRISNSFGDLLYDSKINITGKGPYQAELTIVEGPFVNRLTDTAATISFTTNRPSNPFIKVNGKEFRSQQMMMNMMGEINHEININNLQPDTKYIYTVLFGSDTMSYYFQTSPKPGSRQPFTFAFASDSRAGSGGGERNLYGTNAYILKKLAALAIYENVVFFQFTGNLITGYSASIDETLLQYANWKHTVEPFWHYSPFYTGMGNHEAVVTSFGDLNQKSVQVDKFPFNTFSSEAVFAKVFVNPISGPVSEDGASYDPDPDQTDFPTYSENVYYYIYDNVAIIVLNSAYWYTPSTEKIPEIGGNPHGYIMDQQLNWFKNTIQELNANENMDHIFVTIQTPVLPNSGRAGDAMWFYGNNKIRPTVAGNPAEKGIIERRDELLDIMINESEKVVALLVGDENYSRTKLTNKTIIYPDFYSGKKLKISRPFWQIASGTSEAPHYNQENLPWNSSVEKFSTQHALLLITVDEIKISVKAINPDTLELIEEIVLKE